MHIFTNLEKKTNYYQTQTLSDFTCIPKSCCSQVPTQHKLSLYSPASRAASTERSPQACLVVPVFVINNHFSNQKYVQIIKWKFKIQKRQWGCVKAYKRSLCKVTEDGGHRVERVELSLQNTNFHLHFRFISKWKTEYEFFLGDINQTNLSFGLELNTSAEFSKKNQIEYDRSGQERVLTCVVQHYGAFPTHEYL